MEMTAWARLAAAFRRVGPCSRSVKPIDRKSRQDDSKGNPGCMSRADSTLLQSCMTGWCALQAVRFVGKQAACSTGEDTRESSSSAILLDASVAGEIPHRVLGVEGPSVARKSFERPSNQDCAISGGV